MFFKQNTTRLFSIKSCQVVIKPFCGQACTLTRTAAFVLASMVSMLIVPRVWHIKLFLKGQWWCSVGRVVASDSRDTRFESSHRQKFILNIYCRRYWKDENKEKNYMICNCPLFMLQNLKKKGKITLTASRRNPSRSRWSAPPTRHWWSGRSCLNVRLCGVVEIACWNLRRKLWCLFAQLRS